jgi:3-methyladenine DNA glycosylase AlkD/uncharacterized protein YdhG (YjbR/CyaY superfamily)
MAASPTPFDAALARIDGPQRVALEKLRKAIRAAAPGAEEGVSYGLAAFRWKGKPLAGLGTTGGHCAYYPMSGSVVAGLAADLSGYDTTKGSVRFPADKPLPVALVGKLVTARMAEIDGPAAPDVGAAVASLRRLASKKYRDGMARYAIPTDKAFGVPVGSIQTLGKHLGRNHALAAALWDTRWYEARMLAAFVDEPTEVTPAQMDRWCKDFDNWGICDTVCFHLFDRTPHAFRKVAQWSRRKEEFVKRAAFALLASLAGHDKETDDGAFAECLPLIERAAADERNFVKKGVSWALRGIGHRSPVLHAAAIESATRLAASEGAAARWIGKDVLRDLLRPLVAKKLAKKRPV